VCVEVWDCAFKGMRPTRMGIGVVMGDLAVKALSYIMSVPSSLHPTLHLIPPSPYYPSLPYDILDFRHLYRFKPSSLFPSSFKSQKLTKI